MLVLRNNQKDFVHTNLPSFNVRPKQQIFLVVEVQSTGSGSIGNNLQILSLRVHFEDVPLVHEVQSKSTCIYGCAFVLVLNDVSWSTRASVAAIGVAANLVTEAPLIALVSVRTSPVVRSQLSAILTVACASRRRSLTFVFTIQGGTG